MLEQKDFSPAVTHEALTALVEAAGREMGRAKTSVEMAAWSRLAMAAKGVTEACRVPHEPPQIPECFRDRF